MMLPDLVMPTGCLIPILIGLFLWVLISESVKEQKEREDSNYDNETE